MVIGLHSTQRGLAAPDFFVHSSVLSRVSVGVVLGLLPALVLACLLVGNWMSGGAPVEMMRGGPMVVDIEPNTPMRVVGELEPLALNTEMGDELAEMHQQQMLSVRFCGTECRSNMIICLKPPRENPGAVECKKMMDQCNDVQVNTLA